MQTANLGSSGHFRWLTCISVGTRITLPLLLPVLGLLALSGLLLTEKLTTVAAMQRVSALTELVSDTSALVHEVQRERGASGGFISSKGTELADDLTAQRVRTDTRLAAFDARLQRIGLDHTVPPGSALTARLTAAHEAFSGITDVRRRISLLAITTGDSFDFFTSANTRLLDMVSEAAADVEAPEVARSVSVYLNFLQAKELAGQERAVGTVGFAAGKFDPPRLRRLLMLGDQQDLYFRIIAAAATPMQIAFMKQTVTGDAVDAVMRMRRTAADGGVEGHLDGITGAAWFKAATIRVDLLKQVEDRMLNDLRSLTIGIHDAARTALYATLAAITGLLVLTFIVGGMMIRAIVRPLGTHIRTMQLLSAGQTDLLITGADRRDELGSMAAAITVFRDQAIENQRLASSQAAERARAEADTTAALRDMADRIETETGKALTRVSVHTAAMTVTADGMSASALRTGVAAHSATSAASQTLLNAQTVASAAEQLSASIREISSQMNLSTTVVGRAVAAGNETRATINQLDSKVTQIGTVADMIRDIAARTNLLALNATIEAARAGEAGKGFAVVASEVKALAMQTSRSTEEITRHLSEVKAATLASVDAVGRIGETITEIDAIANSIAAAVEQQGAATAEIARNVVQTAQAADEMTGLIGEVSTEAEENGRQAVQVHDGAAGLATAVSELKHIVMRVVRTSTSKVDRRLTRRYEVNLLGRFTVPGQGTHPCRVLDLSEEGARLAEAPGLSIGTRGTLEIDGIRTRLSFTVCNQYGHALGLIFDQDDLIGAAIRNALEQLVSEPA